MSFLVLPKRQKFTRKHVEATLSSTEALPDFQLCLEIDFPFSITQDSVRVTFEGIELAHWVESSKRPAKLWVKLDVPAGSSRLDIWFDGWCPSRHHPGEVFELFDDFDGEELNTGIWDVGTNPDADISFEKSCLKMTVDPTDPANYYHWIRSKTDHGTSHVIEALIRKLNDPSIFYNAEMYTQVPDIHSFYCQANRDDSGNWHFRRDGYINNDWDQIPMQQINRYVQNQFKMKIERNGANVTAYIDQGRGWETVGSTFTNFPDVASRAGFGLYVPSTSHDNTCWVDYLFVRKYSEASVSYSFSQIHERYRVW